MTAVIITGAEMIARSRRAWRSILIVAAVFLGLFVVIERRVHGNLRSGVRTARRGFSRFLHGPWPLLAGAVALAIGNFATLYLAGRPWGITSAFALWGSKIFAASGIDVASWGYWSSPERAKALHESVFADITSVMDFGIILGALLASGLAGKFKPGWKVPGRSLVARCRRPSLCCAGRPTPIR